MTVEPEWYGPSPRPAHGAVAPGVFLGVGALAAVAAPFLPWVSATAPIVGHLSRTGWEWDHDGIAAAGLGLLVALFAAVTIVSDDQVTRRMAAVVCLISGIMMGGVAIYDRSQARTRIAEVRAQTDLVLVTVGPGIYLLALAGLVTAAAAVVVGLGYEEERR